MGNIIDTQSEMEARTRCRVMAKRGPNVTILGAGYVGLVTGCGLADVGCSVEIHEIDAARRGSLAKGHLPIHEPGLGELWKKQWGRGLRLAKGPLPEDRQASVYVMCVGTPSRQDGSIDLSAVEGATGDLGGALEGRGDYPVVVVKSTVIPGTTEEIVLPALEKATKGKAGVDFGVAANPEFLREGSALRDFFEPDRIVLGVLDKRTEGVLRDLYASLPGRRMVTTPRTAEMIKYASNVFLSAKVSLANEIGNLCKALGIDAYRVMEGVGMDPRIGPRFLEAGLGFGGSCLPKDLRALVAKAESLGVRASVMKAALEVNDGQPALMVKMLKRRLGDLRGKRVAVLGLAFKANTDDVRESRAMPLIRGLLAAGARVAAYDPMASGRMAEVVRGVEYGPSAKAALEGADACLIATDWPEFAQLEGEFLGMRRRLVIDGRHAVDPRGKGIEYEGLCW